MWPPCWIRPSAGLAKINVDAIVSKNPGPVSTAAVARDEGGNFLGGSAPVMEGDTKAKVVEPVTRREGLALASDLGLPAVRVASDCANAVRSIEGEGMGRYGTIVQEIKFTKESFARILIRLRSTAFK